MNTEISDYAKWARANKWTVEDRKSDGYTEFRNEAGELVFVYPATPSRSNRRIADLRVKLRQAGLPWPPLSKKEQRAQRRKAKEGESDD